MPFELTDEPPRYRFWSSASTGAANCTGVTPLAVTPLHTVTPAEEAQWTKEGKHSRIPGCCIAWFIGRYGRATKSSHERYIRLLKKWHEEGKYLFQPGFIPCPKTVRVKDIVFVHCCDDACVKKKEPSLSELIQTYYDPLFMAQAQLVPPPSVGTGPLEDEQRAMTLRNEMEAVRAGFSPETVRRTMDWLEGDLVRRYFRVRGT